MKIKITETILLTAIIIVSISFVQANEELSIDPEATTQEIEN